MMTQTPCYPKTHSFWLLRERSDIDKLSSFLAVELFLFESVLSIEGKKLNVEGIFVLRTLTDINAELRNYTENHFFATRAKTTFDGHRHLMWM